MCFNLISFHKLSLSLFTDAFWGEHGNLHLKNKQRQNPEVGKLRNTQVPTALPLVLELQSRSTLPSGRISSPGTCQLVYANHTRAA